MMDKVPSIFNNLRPLTIGFDDVFDHFESLLDDDYRVTSSRINYPPYDIRKVGDNKFNIEAALAGFNKNDIEVLTKDNTLTIKTKKEKTLNNNKNGDSEVLHKGISKRYFERSFTIADDVKVLGAELKDGLLKVSLERLVPEEKKEKVIVIK
jgi:molecular chaperone IbpA|tara:strand:- start:1057 stop:1512 length:456 start_codon:yes stop_codon:yes gene_type:complete